MNDLNIVNGLLVFPEGCRYGHIGIRNRVIRQVCTDKEDLDAGKEEIRADGTIIFPGMIDSHVHIRGGDFSYREDFTSGSTAAVSSGITTILEMPGCAKPASTLERFRMRVKEVQEKGCISFGLYGGAGADNLEEIPKIAKAGAIGFKTFQMAPVAGRETEFYGLCSETYDDLVDVMDCVHKTGLTLTIHCESQRIIDKTLAKFMSENRNGLKAFTDSRPTEAELESVKQVIQAAQKTKCRVIIAHVSSPETVDCIMQAKKDGVDIKIESCAHYLSFDREQMEPFGVFARMKPPFRLREQVDRLAQQYQNGAIDIIGSDHAPYTKSEKLKNGNNIWETFDGLPGLELTLPLLLKLVEENKLNYEMIAKTFSENTAKIFHLSQKGRIEAGKDADLVFVKKLVHPEIIQCRDLHSKCAESAVIYEGLQVRHKIIKTLYKGKMVFSEGDIALATGSAEIVHPFDG